MVGCDVGLPPALDFENPHHRGDDAVVVSIAARVETKRNEGIAIFIRCGHQKKG